ncbi:WhiB family transcriptional regulator [Nocardioides sp. ChNu-153]|nr:WhiB family transcriptional regulator [Nocardioides sp. ChNu-153]
MGAPGRPCGTGNPEDWFTRLEAAGTPNPTQVAAARARAAALCAGCPVLTECRDHALAAPGLEGIWGGTTPLQRREARTREEAS